MTLGEWLDSKIREEAAETGPAAAADDAEQLDIAALSERLARLSQGEMQTAATPQPAWPGLPVFTVTPAGSRPAEGTLVDSDGVLLPWLTRYRAATLALRPDGYVYAAAPAGAQLPPPPAGFAPASRRTTPTATL